MDYALLVLASILTGIAVTLAVQLGVLMNAASNWLRRN